MVALTNRAKSIFLERIAALIRCRPSLISLSTVRDNEGQGSSSNPPSVVKREPKMSCPIVTFWWRMGWVHFESEWQNPSFIAFVSELSSSVHILPLNSGLSPPLWEQNCVGMTGRIVWWVIWPLGRGKFFQSFRNVVTMGWKSKNLVIHSQSFFLW